MIKQRKNLLKSTCIGGRVFCTHREIVRSQWVVDVHAIVFILFEVFISGGLAYANVCASCVYVMYEECAPVRGIPVYSHGFITKF